jgi:hypothetical protein
MLPVSYVHRHVRTNGDIAGLPFAGRERTRMITRDA